MTVTRTGWSVSTGSLTMLLIGVVYDYPELSFVGLCGILCILAAAATVAVRTAARLERGLVSRRIGEGEPAVCTVTIDNPGRWASPPVLLTETVGGRRTPTRVPGLRRRTTGVTATYQLEPLPRGVYPVAPPEVSHTDAFGLVRRVSRAGRTVQLVVRPEVLPLRSFNAKGFEDDEGATLTVPIAGTAFHGLREYLPGDDTRLIHWPSSARSGALIVREQRDQQQSRRCVLLDTAQSRYSPESFDEAVRITASLCAAASGAGGDLELWTSDVRQAAVRNSRAGAAGWRDATLDFLAAVQRRPHAPGHSQVRQALAAADRGGPMIVVTGVHTDSELRELSHRSTKASWVALVHVGPRQHGRRVMTARVTALGVAGSADFAAHWNGLRLWS
ncbi:DUF58 domain-containing protein [Dactylosporangium sp. NPDC006015]|uniref:DUF58 domain-containing protein n=1 Tax=Dactylosporangium sp. NPDC006015 TaxID=3154576 RepID=UPI0033B09F54